MQRIILSNLLLLMLSAWAGDDSSGPIKYRVDLGKQFSSYEVTDADRRWAADLAGKFKYANKITYFAQTSLSLDADGKPVTGAIYQQVDEPTCFYVLPADVMLKVGTRWAANPGVGGFSVHAPRSKRFLIALNSHCGGVPSLSSTPIVKGPVSWGGHARSRL